MTLFSQLPSLDDRLAQEFRAKHRDLFESAILLATNNDQVVKTFSLGREEFVIKKYPEKTLFANIRSLLGISRAMNSFRRFAQLRKLGVQSPAHLFVARHLRVLRGTSYLIMKKSAGRSMHSMICDEPESNIPDKIIENLIIMTRRIHGAGLSHGDLHSGNILVLSDNSVEVIDLDNMRPNRRKQTKDRARLLQSFDRCPTLRDKLIRGLATRS